ncbi:unnamed protein product [Lymnaea stagnalis]|uniref:Uncharacterized protein n=1 Tax=Lymnaea stagnalis TaxID=6523 RepID=A0AAV2HDZ1_LYMST
MDIPTIQVQSDCNVLSKYTDPIDLSNACRAFYQSRLEITRQMKDRWRSGQDGGSNDNGMEGVSRTSRRAGLEEPRKKNSLDVAIERLRHEMACLMEQDLCLMQQLLTLNEEIEDLKWRKRHVWNMSSSFYSSDMIQSASSLGKVDEAPALKFSTPSSLSLQLEGISTRFSIYNDEDPNGTFNRKTRALKNYAALRNSPVPMMSPLASNSPVPMMSSLASNIPAHQGANNTSFHVSDDKTNPKVRVRASLFIDSKPDRVNSSSVSSSVTKSEAQTQGQRTVVNSDNTRSQRQSLTKGIPTSTGQWDDNVIMAGRDTKPLPTLRRQNATILKTDMESQDSGIHDCNGGSL